MPHAVTNGLKIYYETHGAGFPLLLINGLGSDHREWFFQVPAFAPYFRVVVFDNFGTGDSDCPPGPYATARMADDAAMVLKQLKIQRAHLLGVSLGGMIAQEFALRHPDTVDRLVLACTAPGGAASVHPSAEAMAAFRGAGATDPEDVLRRMLPYLYTESYIAGCPGEIEDFVRRRLEHRTPPEGYLAQMAAVVTHDAADRLGRIGARTLVITGDADRLVPPENSARIAERIPGARRVVVPGAPHRLFAENAETFNRVVLGFLTEP